MSKEQTETTTQLLGIAAIVCMVVFFTVYLPREQPNLKEIMRPLFHKEFTGGGEYCVNPRGGVVGLDNCGDGR